MAGHKITSLWQLQIDPSELPPEGTVTGAAASRLGAHVGARIRQLQEAQLSAERAASVATLPGHTKDGNVKSSDKKFTSSDKEFINTSDPENVGNDKHGTEKRVILITENSNKKTTTSKVTQDDAVKIKKPSPETKENLKVNKQKTTLNFTSTTIKNETALDTTTLNEVHETPPRPLPRNKNSINIENQNKVNSNFNYNSHAANKNEMRTESITHKWNQVESTEITKSPLLKNGGLITALEENNKSTSTSDTNNDPKFTFKLRKPSLNEEATNLQPSTAQFYVHQTNDIATRNIKYPVSVNNESKKKIIPLDLNDDDDDLSDREDTMQFMEETIHLKTITTPEQTLELRLTVSDVSNLTSNYSLTQRRHSGFDSSSDRRGSVDARRGSIDARRGSVDARRGSIDARRGSVDARRGSIDSRRGSLLSPDIIKILPGDDEDECDICRRNSEPFARYNRSFSISSEYIMPNIPESESDSKRGSFFSDENLEAISLKLDAIVVNAEYIESRARDCEERHELEEEAARTQAALDDVAILDREEMQERVTRAARALARCRMILEERAPSIASYETVDRRRSSAVADQQIIRSVALRVMALDSQEAARRRADSGERRGSIDSRRGSIHEGRRGSIDFFGI